MTEATVPEPAAEPDHEAIGFVDALVIGLASTAPAYSLAALEDLGGDVTEQAVERARQRGVEAEAVLLLQRPVDALIQLAAERGARMIAVGASVPGGRS